MKTLLLAAIVALLCMQALHANPMPGGVSEHSESQYIISYPGGNTEGDDCGDDGGDDGKVTQTTTTTNDGKTIITTTKTGGTKVYTSGSSFDDFFGGEGGSDGSTTYKYTWTSGSESDSSGSGGSGSGGSGSGGSGSGGSGSGGSSSGGHKYVIGGDDKCDGENGPCDKGHEAYTFNVGEDDWEFFSGELEEESTTTTTKGIRHLHDTDCEKKLEEINEENDVLTEQLISANKNIETLTSEKSWLLKQLEKCRDDYKCTSEDFETSVSENKMLRKKYDKIAAEYGALKNSYMALTAESKNYKIRVEQLEGELKKSKDVIIQYTNTISEYSITITNLRTTVNEITIKNNNCGSKSEEFRLKWENEVTKVTKYEQNIIDLEITIVELKSKNSKLTGDLSDCQNENTVNDKEIDGLKSELNDSKSLTSQLKSDLAKCEAAVSAITEEFNEDEKRDHEESVKCKKIEIDFGECEVRRGQLEIDYNAEKTNYANCKNDIVNIREENTKNSKQCEENITNLKISFQATITTLEQNLTLEKDNYAKILIQVNSLTNELTLIKNELNIRIKASEELQQKNQYCEDGSRILKENNDKLQDNIDELNGQLSTCIAHNDSIQTDLTTCVSDLDKTSDNLDDLTKKNTENEALIVKLESDNAELEAAKDLCDSELSTLRCDTNQLLAVVDDAETKSLQAIIDIKGLIENAKDKVDKFVVSTNIKCESCSDDTPCIST